MFSVLKWTNKGGGMWFSREAWDLVVKALRGQTVEPIAQHLADHIAERLTMILNVSREGETDGPAAIAEE